MEPQDEDAGLSTEATIPKDSLSLLLENQTVFMGFLRRSLPSEAAAEDLLQQSVLKAIRSPDGLNDKDNLTAWFYRILRNSLTDFYRSRAAEGRKHDLILQNLIDTGETSQGIDDEELLGEVCACLKRLLPTLKPEYADLVGRIDLQGESALTVAKATGITYNNLMVRLHRARQALRKSLEQSCGACARHACLECTCGHGQNRTTSR